jgi:hypothetical protein
MEQTRAMASALFGVPMPANRDRPAENRPPQEVLPPRLLREAKELVARTRRQPEPFPHVVLLAREAELAEQVGLEDLPQRLPEGERQRPGAGRHPT